MKKGVWSILDTFVTGAMTGRFVVKKTLLPRKAAESVSRRAAEDLENQSRIVAEKWRTEQHGVVRRKGVGGRDAVA
jgi:hypothetical protein